VKIAERGELGGARNILKRNREKPELRKRRYEKLRRRSGKKCDTSRIREKTES
jgi:hypothetical protein